VEFHFGARVEDLEVGLTSTPPPPPTVLPTVPPTVAGVRGLTSTQPPLLSLLLRAPLPYQRGRRPLPRALPIPTSPHAPAPRTDAHGLSLNYFTLNYFTLNYFTLNYFTELLYGDRSAAGG